MTYLPFDVIIAVITAYLLGSISSAIVTCKMMRLPDPRSEGSRNPGATNVLRIGGKKAAIITLLGDILKGLIPVLLAKWYGINMVGLSMVAFAAFIGHLYPIFFRFEGGKGVATALGCLMGLSWHIGAALIITWIIIAAIFRYSSLASLVMSITAPLYTWYFTNIIYTLVVCIMSVMLIYKHRSNIKNLIHGQENRLDKKY